MRFSIHQHAKPFVGMVPDNHAASAGTSNSTEVDTLGFDEALWIVSVGGIGSTGTVDVKLQESSTSGSGYADITGATVTQFTDTDDNKFAAIRVNLLDRERYLIAHVTIANVAVDMNIDGVLYSAKETPVSTSALHSITSV